MSLRARAAASVRFILENAAGFAVPITVTNPSGVTVALLGLTKDIAQKIDPETGVLVAAREASVTLSIASLQELGVGLPQAIASRQSKPWVVQFYDQLGVLHTFKVSDARPDQTVGAIVCMLEEYRL